MNNRKIIGVLILVALLLPVTHALESLAYSLTLSYDGKTLRNDGLNLIEGTAPDRINQPGDGFTLKVISFSGNVLHSFKFLIETQPIAAPPREFFDEAGNQVKTSSGDVLETERTSVVLVVPYFQNAKSIDIFYETDALALSVDVSKYSKTTGNNVVVFGLLIVALLGGGAYFLYKKKMSHKKHKK